MPRKASHLMGMQRIDTLGGRMAAVVAMVLLALTGLAVLTFRHTLEREAVVGLQASSRMLATGEAKQLAALVREDDRTALQERLEWLAERERLAYVQLHLPSGAMVASAGPRRFQAEELWWKSDHSGGAEEVYQFEVSIPPDGPDPGSLGQLRVGIPLAVVTEDVRRYARSLALGALMLLLAGLLAVYLVSHRVTRPLRAMAETAEKVSRCEFGHRVDPGSTAEVRQLAAAFNRMLEELAGARAELDRGRHRLEQILESIPAPVAVFDGEQCCEYLNRAAASSPDARERILGQPVHRIWATEDGFGVDEDTGERMAAAMRRAAVDGRVVQEEAEVRYPDGDRVFLYTVAPMAGGEGAEGKVIGYGVDVTQWRRAEQALKASEAKLLQAQKMEAIGRLAGGVAHDFNNLLTAIGGSAELLLDGGGGGEDRGELVEIQRATNRAAALTRQLLTFSRKQNTELRPTDLNLVVSGIEPMLRRLVPPRIRFEIRLSDASPHVLADLGRLEQVIMNIAVNAADAMPDGGVLTLEVRQLDGGERPVRLTVSDTGTGIPDDILPNIFDPFFTTKDPGKGTGLGLATAYGIVDGLGGRIEVASRLGHGTAFDITLPLATHVEAPPAPVESSATETASGCGSVLVVEDQRPVRRFIVRTLTRRGFEVHEAEGPRSALELLDEGLRPDVLLTDIHMPGMEGPELAERVRQQCPDIPVLFISGLGADEVHWVDDGHTAFLQKPFTTDALAGALLDLAERAPVAA